MQYLSTKKNNKITSGKGIKHKINYTISYWPMQCHIKCSLLKFLKSLLSSTAPGILLALTHLAMGSHWVWGVYSDAILEPLFSRDLKLCVDRITRAFLITKLLEPGNTGFPCIGAQCSRGMVLGACRTIIIAHMHHVLGERPRSTSASADLPCYRHAP